MTKIKNGLHNNTTLKQVDLRKDLMKLFDGRPFKDDLLMTNFGLFFRASALSKVFFLHEAYSKVINIPGDFFVYGVWLGQDLVVLESLRAILEPYNSSRKMVGFDTFSGYENITSLDKESDVITNDGYKVPVNYEEYLSNLLNYHKAENCMGHNVEHQLIKGDVTKSSKNYIKDNPSCIIAMAYFDMALYKPTIAALKSIENRLIKGSVIVFDELNDKIKLPF